MSIKKWKEKFSCSNSYWTQETTTRKGIVFYSIIFSSLWQHKVCHNTVPSTSNFTHAWYFVRRPCRFYCEYQWTHACKRHKSWTHTVPRTCMWQPALWRHTCVNHALATNVSSAWLCLCVLPTVRCTISTRTIIHMLYIRSYYTVYWCNLLLSIPDCSIKGILQQYKDISSDSYFSIIVNTCNNYTILHARNYSRTYV